MDSTTPKKVNKRRRATRIGEDATLRRLRSVLLDDSISQDQAIERLRQIMNGGDASARKEV